MPRLLILLLMAGVLVCGGACWQDAMAEDAVAAEAVGADVEFEPGVNVEVYELGEAPMVLAELVPGQTPNASVRQDGIGVGDTGIEGYHTSYLVHFTADLMIEKPGQYIFRLISDDGSRLTLDGEVLVDNDGRHGMKKKNGRVHLEPGAHAMKVEMFQATGPQGLELSWRTPGQKGFAPIPLEALRTQAGLTRVVSPGPKRLIQNANAPNHGDGTPLTEVHPMWNLTTLNPQGPEGFALMVAGMAYMGDGNLAICTFNPRNNGQFVNEPNGKLWLLRGVDGDPEKITVTLAADGLFNPLGVLNHDGHLYVAQRDEITRLGDEDGDGVYEQRATVAKGWASENYHHFTFGPVFKDGFLYAALSTSIGKGGQKITRDATFGYGPNEAHRGSVMKINPDTGDIQYISGGHRTPNGLFIGPDGELFVGENQGAWQPANKINHIQPGRFYGHYNGNHLTEKHPEGMPASDFSDQPLTPPAAYLPHGEIANSPTDGVLLKEGPLAGQLLVSDVKHGGLRRVSLEKVNGEYQGVAFRHSQGFNAGLNRLSFGDDGVLFVGGIGERASWSWQGTTAGLQRLEPTGKTAFEFQTITATADGLTLRYTKPVPEDQLIKLDGYSIQQWRYRPTSTYGGRKFDVEKLTATQAAPSSDRLSVTLTIPGIKAGRVIYVRHNPTSDSGEAMWSPEAWYSMNQLPGVKTNASDLAQPMPRVLIFSKTAKFRHRSIKVGAKSLQRLCQNHGWDSVHSEDASVFTDADLDLFDVVVFLSTTGDILDDEQQAVFEQFIQGGGGFVGIHAATDTEYQWPWYHKLVGGTFAGHPKIQDASLQVIDTDHPSTSHLPQPWQRRDEWYNFKDMNPAVSVLLNLDETSYEGGKMGDEHPASWCHEFDGGRAWYTAGGHTDESFAEDEFMQHVAGGIRWAGGFGE